MNKKLIEVIDSARSTKIEPYEKIGLTGVKKISMDFYIGPSIFTKEDIADLKRIANGEYNALVENFSQDVDSVCNALKGAELITYVSKIKPGDENPYLVSITGAEIDTIKPPENSALFYDIRDSKVKSIKPEANFNGDFNLDNVMVNDDVHIPNGYAFTCKDSTFKGKVISAAVPLRLLNCSARTIEGSQILLADGGEYITINILRGEYTSYDGRSLDGCSGHIIVIDMDGVNTDCKKTLKINNLNFDTNELTLNTVKNRIEVGNITCTLDDLNPINQNGDTVYLDNPKVILGGNVNVSGQIKFSSELIGPFQPTIILKTYRDQTPTIDTNKVINGKIEIHN